MHAHVHLLRSFWEESLSQCLNHANWQYNGFFNHCSVVIFHLYKINGLILTENPNSSVLFLWAKRAWNSSFLSVWRWFPRPQLLRLTGSISLSGSSGRRSPLWMIMSACWKCVWIDAPASELLEKNLRTLTMGWTRCAAPGTTRWPCVPPGPQNHNVKWSPLLSNCLFLVNK